MFKSFTCFGLLMFSAACAVTSAPIYTHDGQEFGVIQGAFRGRFYNYYERGVSYAAGGYCEEAITDFDRAIALRPDDQLRVRTVGVHFIDYFPNRERGVCLYELNRLGEAADALARSLQTVDSERAHDFLGLARNRAVASL